jgi:hypothetical protein
MPRFDTCRRRHVLRLAVAAMAAVHITTGGDAMAEDLTAKLLSTDFATADAALGEAIARRDAALVARALDQSFLEMKIKAARALLEIGDRACVPSLVAALEGNQVAYTGDSETKVMQKELNEVLVAALAKLTGQSFGAVDPQSSADIGRVLQASKAWAAKNRP